MEAQLNSSSFVKVVGCNKKDRSASVVVRNTFVGVLCNKFFPSLAGAKISGGGGCWRGVTALPPN